MNIKIKPFSHPIASGAGIILNFQTDAWDAYICSLSQSGGVIIVGAPRCLKHKFGISESCAALNYAYRVALRYNRLVCNILLGGKK